MPLFKKNNALLRAGNSLRGCCCDPIEPPPPPPPPEPPGPEPPPPPIPPEPPDEFGGGCCLGEGGSTGEQTGSSQVLIWFRTTSFQCDKKLSFNLDGDHTCRDSREHGLRDEYVTGSFSVGCRPTFTTTGQTRDQPARQAGADVGSLGTIATLTTYYNRYSSCSGDAVDDNARTPQTLVTYTVLDGVANINGNIVTAGNSISTGGGVGGIPFNPASGAQSQYTGGRVDVIQGEPHQQAGSGRIPAHTTAHAVVFSVHRLTWYHHDDYDVYVRVNCAGSDSCL